MIFLHRDLHQVILSVYRTKIVFNLGIGKSSSISSSKSKISNLPKSICRVLHILQQKPFPQNGANKIWLIFYKWRLQFIRLQSINGLRLPDEVRKSVISSSYMKFMFHNFKFTDELLDDAVVFRSNVIDQTSTCGDMADILHQFNAHFG